LGALVERSAPFFCADISFRWSRARAPFRARRGDEQGPIRRAARRHRFAPRRCWIEVGGTYAMFDGPSSPVTQTFGLGIFQSPTVGTSISSSGSSSSAARPRTTRSARRRMRRCRGARLRPGADGRRTRQRVAAERPAPRDSNRLYANQVASHQRQEL